MFSSLGYCGGMERDSKVLSFTHGLQASCSRDIDWSQFHQHNGEMELAFHPRGPVTYQFGARTEQILPGETFLYWGAIPHRAILKEPGDVCCFLTIPLSVFVQMELPSEFINRLFSGEIFKEQDPQMREMDILFFQNNKEQADKKENSYLEQSILHWVQYRLFRFVSNMTSVSSQTPETSRTDRPQDSQKVAYVKVRQDKIVEHMYRYITTNYTKDITVPQLASLVNLNPNYANTLFREKTGLSIGRFVTMMRIYKAQSLLLTTDLKIIDISLESGFQSLGNFYKMFQAHVGESPSKYRSRHMPKVSFQDETEEE
jgi:AraC-like DNA-binding protein